MGFGFWGKREKGEGMTEKEKEKWMMQSEKLCGGYVSPKT
jgi:hypothetical protein